MHNLYNKLIAGDLESSRKKTQIQLEVERQNVEYSNQGVEELREDNKMLKKNIKRTKEVLDNKLEAVKA